MRQRSSAHRKTQTPIVAKQKQHDMSIELYDSCEIYVFTEIYTTIVKNEKGYKTPLLIKRAFFHIVINFCLAN